jgi:hypothetical protein
MRVQAALTTCGLVFFGCGGIAVDTPLDGDSSTEGDSGDDYQYDIVTPGDDKPSEPTEVDPDLDVWLSDDVAEPDQPGAEGTPCDCAPGEYGIAMSGSHERVVFNLPLDNGGLSHCGLPSTLFDECGFPVELGGCHETQGCILFIDSPDGTPRLQRWHVGDNGNEGVELIGDDLKVTREYGGGAVFGVLEFRSGADVYQGTYRFCAPYQQSCEP